LFAFKNRRGI